VWPALTALASGRAMAEHLHLVDSVDEAAEVVLAAHPARASREAGAPPDPLP